MHIVADNISQRECEMMIEGLVYGLTSSIEENN
jgi:hypothetical protein